MNKYTKDAPVDVPKWDIALEGLLNDEYRRLKRPMHLDDLRRVGQVHKIRSHDITATLCQLDRYGKWGHRGFDEAGRPMAEDAVEGLYQHGRLDEDVAEKYSVTWFPR